MGLWIPEFPPPPLPKVLTPEAQAVLDTAVAFEDGRLDGVHGSTERNAFIDAVRIYRASIVPADPVEAFIVAVRTEARLFTINDPHRVRLMSAAIAMEESRK